MNQTQSTDTSKNISLWIALPVWFLGPIVVLWILSELLGMS